MIIRNKSKAVKVLKTIGLPTLRVLPGHNNLGDKKLDDYTEKSHINKAIADEFFEVVDGNNMTKDERLKAEYAKEKNDMLNKNQKIAKANEKKLSQAEGKLAKTEKQLAKTEDKLKKTEEKMEAMSKRLDAIEKKGKRPDNK